MVVDTSAITALLMGEDDRDLFEDLILSSPVVVMSVASVVETAIVLRNKRRDHQAAQLDELLSEFRIDVRPVSVNQGFLARKAFEQFEKGRHPARLNFGDCLTYGLAKARDDILLFKGDDFAKTDVSPAWRP